MQTNLPKTADGVSIVPEMSVWLNDGTKRVVQNVSKLHVTLYPKYFAEFSPCISANNCYSNKLFLDSKIKQLQSIVNKLPKTFDDVPITLGMTIWLKDGSPWIVSKICETYIVIYRNNITKFGTTIIEKQILSNRCYSVNPTYSRSI